MNQLKSLYVRRVSPSFRDINKSGIQMGFDMYNGNRKPRYNKCDYIYCKCCKNYCYSSSFYLPVGMCLHYIIFFGTEFGVFSSYMWFGNILFKCVDNAT